MIQTLILRQIWCILDLSNGTLDKEQTMRNLSPENHNNRRKYTETDVEEIRQAQAEQAQMEADFDAKMAERKATVKAGLIKYGFSEQGAALLVTIIAQGCDYSGESRLDKAVRTGKIAFATEEKAQAVQRAFSYYWS